MSYIFVKVYDGDPEDYEDREDNKGELIEEHSFTDGEELMAVSFIVDLMDNQKHFDVRQWIN